MTMPPDWGELDSPRDPPTEQSECPRCTEWKRLGLSDTCPDCDAIAESDGPALKCQYPDCLDGYLQEFSAEGLRVKGNPCPTCHGTGEKP